MGRRWAAWLIVLALMTVHAHAACIVDTGEGMALVRPSGEVLISGIDISELFEVRPDALYAVGRVGAFGLYDDDGALVSDEPFDMIYDAGDVLIYRQGAAYGAMTPDGRVVIPPEWSRLTYAGDGRFLALRPMSQQDDPLDDQPDEIVAVSLNGEPTYTGVYTASGLDVFHDGRMPYTDADGLCGYLDGQGHAGISPRWDYAGPFDQGAAVVSDGESYGLIDTEGELLQDVIYVWMGRSADCAAGMRMDGTADVFSADGRQLLCRLDAPSKQLAVAGGFVISTQQDGTRVYDLTGACVCEASSRALFTPGVDGQLVASDGAWGEACQRLMNPDGSMAGEACQRLLPLCPGRYAFMTMRGVTYNSDALGGLQTSWNYDSVRYGLMDGAGRQLLAAEYVDISPAGDGMLVLRTEDAVMLADLDGVPVITWSSGQGEASSSEAGV